MDLSIYDIIVGPVITDKAYRLSKMLKQVVFRVHPQSNKPLIKQAVEKLFNVKVEDVKVINRAGKVRRVGKHVVQGPRIKKAIITLKKGSSLDVFDQAGAGVVTSDHAAQTSKKQV